MGDAGTNPTHRPMMVALVTMLVLACLVETSVPASARRAPKRKGPLSFDTKECDREKEIWRDPKTGLIETVAKTETCVLF